MGAPFFGKKNGLYYQTFIQGYDSEWTEWSDDPQIKFPPLGFGDFKLRVRARNCYGTVSKEDAFAFRVLAPWYFTWWAYSLYGLTGLLFIALVVKARFRKGTTS